MQILRGRTTGIDSLAISPDSQYVVAGDDDEIRCWDMADPKCKPRVIAQARGYIDRMQFTAAATLFANFENCWCRYDLAASAATILYIPRQVGSIFTNSIVHPTGSLIKTVGYDDALETLRVTDTGFKPLETADRVIHFPWFVNFDPSGSRYLVSGRLVGGSHDKYHLLDSATDSLLNSLELFPHDVVVNECSPFSPDGHRFYAVCGCRLSVFDCDTGGLPVANCDLAERVSYPELAIHPDGRILATVENEREVTFRDAETLQVMRTYDFAMPKVTCVAFTPDGTRCVVGNSRGKVLLFDVE